MYTSSNPVFANSDKFQETYGDASSNVATLQGVVNKTGILLMIAIFAGALAYTFLPATTSVLMTTMIGSMVVCIGVGYMMYGNPTMAPKLAPVYAVIEGVCLGVFTAFLDNILASIEATKALAAGAAGSTGTVSLAMPAFLITISIMLAMLGLYSARILRPTERFKSVLSTLVVGVMILYALSWIIGMFGMSIPFLRLSSATEGGMAPYIGLGISLFILGIASFCLIVDFGRAEEIVEQRMPKHMEWFAAFGLLVTLAWIYYEAVKLSFRLYLMFGDRD